MDHKTRKPRARIELTASWGNDDADSTIKISPRRWRTIQDGAEYKATAWGWYEGRRFPVVWRFAGGEVAIVGNEAEYVLDLPIEELIVQTLSSEES